jgi:hypothetical protein
MHLAICIPVYDDWPSALVLLGQLDAALAGREERVDVMFVDDGGSQATPSALQMPPRCIARVSVLRLRRNLGHQRAIAIGLTSLYVGAAHDAVIVMDGDGEDRAGDVPKLIDSCARGGWSHVVFAQRGKRTEGVGFRIGYSAFKLLHQLLVGRKVEVGNFSIVPRAPRIAGTSRMNFNALVLHGLSAISVYSDIIGVRLLKLSGLAIGLVLAALFALVAARVGTALVIPPWAIDVAGVLLLSLMNLTLISMALALFTLRSRADYGFLPIRDHAHYVLDQRVLQERA